MNGKADIGSLAGQEGLDSQDGVLRERAFKALLKLASKRSGEGFFGDATNLAVEAYRKSLIGQAFPSFWMEVPLSGKPGFDFHVYYDRGQVLPGERFASDCGFGMQALFDWYFGVETGGVGVGFAHDLRGGRIETGAYVNFNKRPLQDPSGFFDSLGTSGSFGHASALLARLPETWRPWYLGIFPDRPGAGARVGAFVSRERQAAYASDPHALAADLSQAGFTAFDGEMLAKLSAMAALPFQLELQLDATGDGAGDTLGADLALGVASAASVRETFAAGAPAARACELLEEWGAADDRWRRIPDVAISRVVPLLWEGEAAMLLMACIPAFIKAKWVATRLQPAKAYLQCASRKL